MAQHAVTGEGTLVALFEARVHASGSGAALLGRRDERWEPCSWQQWWETSERLAAALLAQGVVPGDHVALLSHTRMEWAWAELAILMIGCVVVPLYPTHTGEQLIWALEHACARALVIEEPALLERLALAVTPETRPATLAHITVIDSESVTGQGAQPVRRLRAEDIGLDGMGQLQLDTLEGMIAQGRRALALDAELVARARARVGPQTLATIVYTSGTQGRGRGVMLAHQHLVAELDAMARLGLLEAGQRQLLVLPLAHILGRMLLWAGVRYGLETALTGKLGRLVELMQELRPHIMGGVPQIFENIRAHMAYEFNQVDSIQASALRAGYAEGQRLSDRVQRGERPGLRDVAAQAVLERTLFARVRAVFGGSLRFFISGGAPLPASVAAFFHACGVLVLEGWGMTETCGASTFNLPSAFLFGAVGQPLPGVDVAIAEDEEVLVRGPTVMLGYWRDEEASAEAIDAAGWLHTGDLGRFDSDGFLRITGRKREILVTSGGKKIAPLHIEAALQAQAPIQQAVLFGDNHRYIVALLVPREAPLRAFAAARGLDPTRWEALVAHPEVRVWIQEHVDEVNARLAGFETIRRFALLTEPLTIERGELTPTLKPRRARIAETRREELERLYDAPASRLTAPGR
jgi:long-chain acyl-CoA synthetase